MIYCCEFYQLAISIFSFTINYTHHVCCVGGNNVGGGEVSADNDDGGEVGVDNDDGGDHGGDHEVGGDDNDGNYEGGGNDDEGKCSKD